VLRQQRNGKPSEAPIVIDYIASRRQLGGRGWPMVLAAEELCRQQGIGSLWSAADLTQDGVGAEPGLSETSVERRGPSAVDAHKRWGFVESSKKEWRTVGLELYDESRCRVLYMRKDLPAKLVMS
ncbi:unnamed protein product, partial [Polarella glacialis]